MEVPLPISSNKIKLRSLKLFKILAVSFISTMNVDSPALMLSFAPTRVNTLSTIPILTRFAGTKEPICAMSTMRAVCRNTADFPDMFGPVIIMICCVSLSSVMSFAMYGSFGGRRNSIMACLPCSISNLFSSVNSGAQYLFATATVAKEANASISASTRAFNCILTKCGSVSSIND